MARQRRAAALPVEQPAAYRVRVSDGWTVYDGERQRNGGEVVEASPEVAAEWLRAGLIDRQVPID